MTVIYGWIQNHNLISFSSLFSITNVAITNNLAMKLVNNNVNTLRNCSVPALLLTNSTNDQNYSN